jgi:hypothetical protein
MTIVKRYFNDDVFIIVDTNVPFGKICDVDTHIVYTYPTLNDMMVDLPSYTDDDILYDGLPF